MMRQAINTVLAFAIRYRVFPTGRVPAEPRLSVVDGLATHEASRFSELPSMAKVNAEIDNYFTPSSRHEDALYCVVFGVVALAAITSLIALMRTIGV
jgi:hypothetical protein